MKRTNHILISIMVISTSFLIISCSSNKSNKNAKTEITADTGFKINKGANDLVLASSLQPDGKIIIGGWFTTYNDTVRKGIARLNQDGSLDKSFNPGAGADYSVDATLVQPDGKIIIGAGIKSPDGSYKHGVVRSNADGSLDKSFITGTGADYIIDFMTLQPDGKIIICGRFSSYNGIPRNCIARLNADGSLDTSFKSNTDGFVLSTSLEPDGKIIIGGEFKKYNGIVRKGIARLNSDGSLDTSFDPGKGVGGGGVFATLVQPDGKILIGGYFTSFSGRDRNNIARLNADGSLDYSFNPDMGYGFFLFNYWPGGNIRTISLQPDGKIIIGGNFRYLKGSTTNYVARMNANGSIDRSFNFKLNEETNVWTTLLQPDGKIIIGCNPSKFQGKVKSGLARLNADGSLDTKF